MTEHNLKILPEYFDAILNHFKRFEVRNNDRCYQIGDYVRLREWDGADYTGQEVMGRITCILPWDELPDGIKEEYVVFGFRLEWVTAQECGRTDPYMRYFHMGQSTAYSIQADKVEGALDGHIPLTQVFTDLRRQQLYADDQMLQYNRRNEE